MARKVSSKPDSGNSTATIGFESGIRSFDIRHSGLFIGPARRLDVMNLDLRGIKADFGPPASAGPNTFRRDLHPDLSADWDCPSLSYSPSNGPR
jgi:hypothetical protein